MKGRRKTKSNWIFKRSYRYFHVGYDAGNHQLIQSSGTRWWPKALAHIYWDGWRKIFDISFSIDKWAITFGFYLLFAGIEIEIGFVDIGKPFEIN